MTTPFLHVVTGKGGVGKTTVACALAMSHLQAGRRVLLVELNGRGRAAEALGAESKGYVQIEAQPGLSLIDLTPEQSLKEYVLLIIKLEALYRLVFENRFVRSFLRLLPALGELTMLGKVWYEWTLPASTGGGCKFEAIVIDAPATGHARAILSAPLAVMASVPTGPMRDNAKRIDDMLLAAGSSLVVVTTPDDTPVAEAEELLAYAQGRGFARVDVVANRCLQPLSAEGQAAAEHLSQSNAACAPLAASLRARAERQRAGERHLGRLASGGHRPVRLPQVTGGLAEPALARFAAALGPLWAAK